MTEIFNLNGHGLQMREIHFNRLVLSAQRYHFAALAVIMCLSVCPSVRPSVTSRCYIKTAVGSRKQRHAIAPGR